ncbi:unnamed protein product [Pedinophyceae sp. YPF-701]|nr:unnamed protein product [Pedinophyceae sp. YPF-701]
MSPLRILCLHGSRQTGDIFYQRISKLRARATGLATFHFIDGPHTLPQEDGQDIPTRCWWRSAGTLGRSVSKDEILRDWSASADVIRAEWSRGRYDGVLGFSNGAAATVVAVLSGLLPRCKFAIVASGYAAQPMVDDVAAARTDMPDATPTLHLFSEKDTAVTAEQSRAAMTLFRSPESVAHRSGHALPHTAAEMDRILAWVRRFADAPRAAEEPSDTPAAADDFDPEALSPDIRDELEALSAIYGEDVRVLSSTSGGQPRLIASVVLAPQPGLDGPAAATPPSAAFRVVLTIDPQTYPAQPPAVDISGPLSRVDPRRATVLAAVREASEGMVGEAMVYTLAEWTREFLDEKFGPGGDLFSESVHGAGGGLSGRAEPGGDADVRGGAVEEWWEEEEIAEGLVQEATVQASRIWQGLGQQGRMEIQEARGGGRLDVVVGLVGKPSAGKSSIFNGCCKHFPGFRMAAMSPQPFTTIDPNVSSGVVAVPCPCKPAGVGGACGGGELGHTAWTPWQQNTAFCRLPASLRDGTYASAWGRDEAWRLHKITVKDVAGLVPGAYQGKGRGNAFLNDLLDADALVLVADASGETDEAGCAAAADGADAHSIMEETRWVRAELHRWIYTNVRRKWASIRRKPAKIKDMLCGYRASQAFVRGILQLSGIDVHQEEKLRYTEVLQWGPRALHLFVAVFLQARFPLVVAMNKCDRPRAADRIRRAISESSEGDFMVPTSATAEARDITNDKGAEEAAARVTQMYGGTGVLAALTSAVALAAPVAVFPVRDLDELVGADPSLSSRGRRGVNANAAEADTSGEAERASGVLLNCVLMKPGSTVFKAYDVLRKPPLEMVDGDFVRAECLPRSLAHRPARKEETLSPDTRIVRIMTNKRRAWQGR